MNIVKQLSRILFGLVFIFSGFVKGIDPWGSAYKFTDYFNAMGLDWMLWAAFPLGVLLAFAEFAIGVAFLFNWAMRLFSWLGLLFMAFFTPLTLWIAVKNPVTDCGCFGDALVISNWETFYKNLVFITFAIIAVVNRKWFADKVKSKIPALLSIGVFIVYFGIVYHSYNHLPIFDFRPYKVGTNIPEAMTVPADAPQEVYENTFYYKNKNTGEVEEFAEDNYPWQDTTNWEYHDMESKLVQEGYEPPIHDFTIESPEGDDIKDFFIYDQNYVFMLVAYDLFETSTKSQNEINALAHWAMDHGYSFVCLTSTLQEEALMFAEEHQAPYEFFNCDEITLKTMIRSNPGLMVIKDGTILGKWHYNDIPNPLEFEAEFINE
ncbi:DoxX family protein [Draconibacterium sp. IB214405]|uniref:BT_3928 family protein n=1 Tax=Draconibacterium sp. IB214405 TaxID=3097352 RepID=UPI002A11C7CD|nr:BT_3928 family protein [Draconibacterium sp. IB214405]MDX8339994.1 DoxX family protein [Draconibacterium sp. IB214405]